MGQETTGGLLDDYEVVDVLSWGGFSVVRKGIMKSGNVGKPVAIKTLKRFGVISGQPALPWLNWEKKTLSQSLSFPMWKQVPISDALLTNEILVMRRIVETVSRHENVIELYDVCEDRNGVHLILELCSGGELFNRIVAKKQYCKAEAVLVVRQIARGLEAIHKASIVHRDLKPKNCLFLNEQEDSPPKIMDFGLRSVDESDPVIGLFGCIDYVSPEALSLLGFHHFQE